MIRNYVKQYEAWADLDPDDIDEIEFRQPSEKVLKQLFDDIRNDNIQGVESYIYRDYDPNAKDKDGNTPLKIADKYKKYEIAKLLLKFLSIENKKRKELIKTVAQKNWFGGYRFPELYFIYREARMTHDFQDLDNVFCYYGLQNTSVSKLFSEYSLNQIYYNSYGHKEEFQFKPLCLTVSIEKMRYLAIDNRYIARHGTQKVSHELPKEFDPNWGLSRKGVPNYILGYYCGPKFKPQNCDILGQLIPALLSNEHNWKINHACIVDNCINLSRY